MNLKPCLGLLFSAFVVSVAGAFEADTVIEESPTDGRLEFVAGVPRDSLDSVTSVSISSDGKFLYASAWQAAAVNVFARNVETGELTHLQEIVDSDNLDGATALRLSPDEKYAVATAFRSDAAVLFRRNDDGTLELADVAMQDVDDVTGLEWAIDATFSNDSQFVYVANGRSYGTVTAFEITPEATLQHVETNTGIEDCFANVRGIVTRPKKNLLIATSSEAGCLVVLEQSSETGTTDLHELIEDENGEVSGLDGAMALALSPDGQFVYVSAGRFRGDNAIGVYQFDEDDRLNAVQELFDGDDIANFKGGNEIAVTPDGKNVYAVASNSSSLAAFGRDLDTGELKYLETIANAGGSLQQAAGICVSPDSRFVYVAAEGSGSISVYRRQDGHSKNETDE